MDFLPKEIEDLIFDYKEQMEFDKLKMINGYLTTSVFLADRDKDYIHITRDCDTDRIIWFYKFVKECAKYVNSPFTPYDNTMNRRTWFRNFVRECGCLFITISEKIKNDTDEIDVSTLYDVTIIIPEWIESIIYYGYYDNAIENYMIDVGAIQEDGDSCEEYYENTIEKYILKSNNILSRYLKPLPM